MGSLDALPSSANIVPPPIPGRPAVLLPKKLFFQLDNSAKDNKNRYVMALCSLLTARRVFKEVTVGFLIVGHTHEDIDMHFSYLSKLLKMKNTYVLADLMKAFMDSQKTTAFMPELVQELVGRCISLSSMLRRKAMIWARQSCVTRFVLNFCPSPAVLSLNGSTCL